MEMDWAKVIVDVLAGLAVLIPLVLNLIKYVQQAVKEKNWNELMKLAIEYMQTAEEKFSDGATRKQWVMAMIQQSAISINYTLDEAALAKISELIDDICTASKTLNKRTAE